MSAVAPVCMAPTAPATERRRLVLGRAHAGFDSAADVAIAPWCFLAAEEAFANWQALPFVDGIATPEDRAQAARDVRLLANHWVDRMAESLERRHGETHDREYWRILVLPWLLYVLQAAWKRYRLVADFAARHAGERFVVEVWTDDVNWAPEDLADFDRRILHSHGFNFWLTSRTVSAIAPDGWELIPSASPTADLMPAPFVPSALPDLRSQARRWVTGGRFRRVVGARWAGVALGLLVHLMPHRPRRVPPRSRPDAAAVAERFPAPFLQFVEDLLPAVMPKVLGERYAEMAAIAARHRQVPGKMSVIGPLLNLDEGDKFDFAHAAEAGERIVCTQHGGGAITQVNVAGTEIEYQHDAYLTWGWQRREDYDGRMVSVPSPLYSRYADKHHERAPELVFVAGEERLFAPRLETGHEPTQAFQARRQRLAFLQGVPDAVRPALRYRAYPGGLGVLDDIGTMRRQHPGLKVLGDALEPHLMGCRLMVVDHPTTTFSLALAANVPTIAILDPAVWTFSRQATPFIDELAAAGIVVATPEDALMKLAEVWDDVAGWWSTPDVQSARHAFCDAYAPTSRLWWWHWAKAMWRL